MVYSPNDYFARLPDHFAVFYDPATLSHGVDSSNNRRADDQNIVYYLILYSASVVNKHLSSSVICYLTPCTASYKAVAPVAAVVTR